MRSPTNVKDVQRLTGQMANEVVCDDPRKANETCGSPYILYLENEVVFDDHKKAKELEKNVCRFTTINGYC